MPKFTEEQLNQMCRPASNTEEIKLKNAESMLRKALSTSTIVHPSKYDIFGQGSYANNTNIRLNSDIDINISYKKAFYYDVPEGKTGTDYGLNNQTTYSFHKFKNNIEYMLAKYYGCSEVIRKNKCITVKGNTNRIQVDVVPTWQYRRYDNTNNQKYIEGVILFADDGQKITNYPKQHITNGIDKNTQCLRRFKRLTRIFKNIHIFMKKDNYYSNKNISSFLLECLAFNVPSNIYVKNTDNYMWNKILKDAILYLYNSTKEGSSIYKEWGEVSELLYLMKGSKWDRQTVNDYMLCMWNYLELNYYHD